MRTTQGFLNLGRSVAASEDEPEITGAFGQGQDRVIETGGNLHARDTWNLFRLLSPVNLPQDSPLRNWDHHYPNGVFATFQLVNVRTGRLHQDQVFECHAGAKLQHGRAETADRSAGNLKNPRTILVDAQFGMHWSLSQTKRSCRIGGTRGDRHLNVI